MPTKRLAAIRSQYVRYSNPPLAPRHLPKIIRTPEEPQEPAHNAQEIEARQDAETPTLGLAFVRDADGANAFSKLSRYETAIERGLYKALHELQRLQAARRADGSAPPPAAIDVDVSGVSGMSLRGSCYWSRDAVISNVPALPLRTPSSRAHRS